MTANVRIRDARLDEHDAIRELTLAAYAQYAVTMPHWEMYRGVLLRALNAPRPAERIVAESGGALVGSVLLYPPEADVHDDPGASAGWPEFRLLAVLPAAQGRGVGRALLEECIRRARGSGAETLGAHSEIYMADALRMYARAGFVRAPETDFHPGPGVHVMGFRLDLNDSQTGNG